MHGEGFLRADFCKSALSLRDYFRNWLLIRVNELHMIIKIFIIHNDEFSNDRRFLL